MFFTTGSCNLKNNCTEFLDANNASSLYSIHPQGLQSESTRSFLPCAPHVLSQKSRGRFGATRSVDPWGIHFWAVGSTPRLIGSLMPPILVKSYQKISTRSLIAKFEDKNQWFLNTKSMPKDGIKNITQKKIKHPFNSFFVQSFVVCSPVWEKATQTTTRQRLRSRKTSSFVTTGWWPRTLEEMAENPEIHFFSWHPEVFWRELPTQVSISTFWLLFFRNSVMFFAEGTSEKK